MPTVDITREHSLGKEEARQRAQQLADKLVQKLDVKCSWQGDQLTFKRSGADGCITVSDADVRVQVNLGMMLTPMAGMVKSEVQKALEKYLA